MKYLKAALKAVYEGDALLNSALKNLYFIDKPASGQRPFAVIKPMPGSHIYTSRNRIDWLPIHFEVEGRTADSVSDVAELLYSAYDNAVLSYTGSSYSHISIRRVDFDGPNEQSGTHTFSIYYVIQRAKQLA